MSDSVQNALVSAAITIHIYARTHCVKSVRIQSFSGPRCSAFGFNTARYGVLLRIQSKCGKIRTRITPNTDTYHAMTYSSHCIDVSLIVGMEHVLLTNRPETGTNVPDMHNQELEHKPSTVDLAANVSRSPSSEIYKQQDGMS